jgi:hypothetical protein
VFTSVPDGLPAPGCTTRPAGLSTTRMCSSSKITGTGISSGERSSSGRRASTRCPPRTLWEGDVPLPSTSKRLSSISRCTRLRLIPSRLATSLSTRSPVSSGSTLKFLCGAPSLVETTNTYSRRRRKWLVLKMRLSDCSPFSLSKNCCELLSSASDGSSRSTSLAASGSDTGGS